MRAMLGAIEAGPPPRRWRSTRGIHSAYRITINRRDDAQAGIVWGERASPACATRGARIT